MTASRIAGAVNTIVSGTKNELPVVNILGFSLAGNGLARIVCEVTHNKESKNNHALALTSIASKFDDKMEPIDGSFRSMSRAPFSEKITGLLSVKRQVIPAVEDNMKGFRATAANMFMDDEKNMWVLHRTESGEILVKNTGIDDDLTLTKLLETRCSQVYGANHNEMRAMCSAISSSVEGGDYISYVDINNTLRQGYVVATTDDSSAVVIPYDTQSEEIVSLNAVTDIHDKSELPQYERTKDDDVDLIATSARGGVDLSFILSYYRKIYSANPSFYQAFAQRIKKHAFA